MVCDWFGLDQNVPTTHNIIIVIPSNDRNPSSPVFFYSETWTSNLFVPTLLGQYIIKNFVLISAAIVIAATCGGGVLISDPEVAKKAQHQEKLAYRFRRLFKTDPELK